MRTDVVEQHQFVTLNGCGTPVFSRWTYLAGDPYVVNLSFRTDRGRWIEWSFARDLVVEGLGRPAGLGDVRVRPDFEFPDEVLVIELESPDGYALVEMCRTDAEGFVEDTRDLVPLGAESDLLDIDAFIAQIIEV